MTDLTDKPRSRPPGRRTSPSKPSLSEPPADADSAARDRRVAKVMARAGLCSRRDAEAWIRAGRVAVNGTTIDSPAINVGSDDVLTVDGATVGRAERTRLFLFHKPRGLVTTAKDPEGRDTVFDVLPSDLPRVVTVGRLDINTEGLMLLTNDGGLARTLELPATGWLRRYRVRANGEIDQSRLDALADGVSIDGVDYAGIEATLDRGQGANVWLTMGLREGKNREIKRVLEHLGLVVNRLIRVSFGPFQLGDLAEGAVEEIRTRVLRDQLGPALASQAGVDFEGPVTATVVTREVHAEKVAERRDRPSRDRPAPVPASEHSTQVARRHVSSLRAAEADAALGPRRKTARTATADRRGRAVAVERVTTAGSKSAEGGLHTRNARRFAQQREDAEGGPEKVRAPRPRADAERSRTGPRAGAPAKRPHFGTRDDGPGGRSRYGQGGAEKRGAPEREAAERERGAGERGARARGPSAETRRFPARDRAPEAESRPGRPPGRPRAGEHARPGDQKRSDRRERENAREGERPARDPGEGPRPPFRGAREDRAPGPAKGRGRPFGGSERPAGDARRDGGGKPPRPGKPGGAARPRSGPGGGKPPRSGPKPRAGGRGRPRG